MLRNTLNTFITATLIMLLGVSSTAQAIVPMGNLMGSTSVTFDETELKEKSPPVYVPLKPSEPTITLIEEIEDWIPNVTTSRVYTYAVTSTANGLDTYSLAAVYNEPDSKNIASSPTVIPNTPIALDLGATAAISSNGKVITVPYDKDGGEGSVNGIKALDTVVIGGTPYPVTSVSNKADELSKITLGGDDPAPSIALGTRIAERGKFEVTVSGVALTGDGEGRADFTITATSLTHQATEPLSFAVLVPVQSSFEKYVRNVTTPGEDRACIFFTWQYASEACFHSEDVSAEEGHVLEYLIVLNAGNQGEHTKIILNETLSPFVTYVAKSAKVAGVEIADNEDGTSPILTRNHIIQADYEAEPENLIIAANTSAHIAYQVKVIGGDGGGGEWATNLTGCSFNEESGLWNPEVDNDATKCKGVKWNAANGPRNPDGSGPMLEHNPVCWDRNNYSGWQEDGENPWVVGTAAEYNNEAYDCRTKCAGESGDSFGHCATDGWWNNDAAKSTAGECGLIDVEAIIGYEYLLVKYAGYKQAHAERGWMRCTNY